MKKSLPWIIAAVFTVWVLASLRMPKEKGFAFNEFGRLPVVANGRFQPLDSLARNTMLQLREKQTANLEPWKGWNEKPRIISATEWLLGVMTKPEEADSWPVFRIDNPDVKSLLALPAEASKEKMQDGKHFSWNQVKPKMADLRREAARANEVEASKRRPYDQALLKLWGGQVVYNRLKYTLGPAASPDLDKALVEFKTNFEAGRVAYLAREQGKDFDAAALEWLGERFEAPIIIPANDPGNKKDDWKPVARSIVETSNTGVPLHFAVPALHRIAAAYLNGKVDEFNAAVADYHQKLAGLFPQQVVKGKHEQFFNHIEPFYKAMILDVCAFILALGFWVKPGQWDWIRRAAIGLVLLALLIHTLGLGFRMFLEGRPPVTNLYSSAIFIGWGATILGLILESFWKNSIGVVISSVIGFLSLIIAHHLSLSGDTMKMLEAVLDTNFWLATHVVVVTLGYASTFVAGFLGIIYVLRGVLTKSLDEATRKSLNRMIYGILCFATLFSFVGTVLGGIWADQSWGRFWGWDPKENGALIIVLWNALILHARWGGMVRERGLATMAVVGNIVTSWSWFGVNMLNIGLHSYGFMGEAFKWLLIFVGSQLVLIALGLLPATMWRSLQGTTSSSTPKKDPQGKKSEAPFVGAPAKSLEA
ncbi:MAG: cytochrome c assembly protein [Verrucomicrobiales bacterium]|nr:cytochrome c assembly protein [Verrucomicrobiales bacterium]